eukprot:scaffold44016_cov46-Prasinocladus_malaysianus.AAC.4
MNSEGLDAVVVPLMEALALPADWLMDAVGKQAKPHKTTTSRLTKSILSNGTSDFSRRECDSSVQSDSRPSSVSSAQNNPWCAPPVGSEGRRRIKFSDMPLTDSTPASRLSPTFSVGMPPMPAEEGMLNAT